jgi:hypothetical protein
MTITAGIGATQSTRVSARFRIALAVTVANGESGWCPTRW